VYRDRDAAVGLWTLSRVAMTVWILVVVYTLPPGVVVGDRISQYMSVYYSADACIKSQEVMQRVSPSLVWKCESDTIK
jgi:hypothetical protein